MGGYLYLEKAQNKKPDIPIFLFYAKMSTGGQKHFRCSMTEPENLDYASLKKGQLTTKIADLISVDYYVISWRKQRSPNELKTCVFTGATRFFIFLSFKMLWYVLKRNFHGNNEEQNLGHAEYHYVLRMRSPLIVPILICNIFIRYFIAYKKLRNLRITKWASTYRLNPFYLNIYH
jgi:hypothetical protein